MRRAAELREDAEHVTAFRDALRVFTTHWVQDWTGFTIYEWVPKKGRAKAAAAARAEVGRLSGYAAPAADHSGHAVGVAMQGVGQTVLNPIGSWYSALQGPGFLEIDQIFDYCEQVIGRLHRMAAEAETRERSLAGRLARLVGFPARVRALVGPNASKVTQVAATGAGVLLITLVGTVVGGVILAVVLAWLNLAQ